MLTAAEDIIAKQEAKSEQPHGSGNSSDSKPLCYVCNLYQYQYKFKYLLICTGI
jgi:hypothetical protein